MRPGATMAPVHPVAVSVYVTAVSAFVIAGLVIGALVWLADQLWRRVERSRRRSPYAYTQRNWRTHP